MPGIVRVVWICTVVASFPLYLCAIEPPTGIARKATDFGFHGHVKSVRIDFTESDGTRMGRRKPSAEYVFDPQSRLIRLTHYSYDASGKLQDAQVFRYVLDAQGRVIEIDMFDKGAPPKEWQRHKQIFDSLGRCVEERDVDADSDRGRTVYEYDGEGNAVKETEYNSDNTLFAITEDRYDAHHRLLSEKIVQMNPPETLDRNYNSHGNLVDSLTYRNGVLKSHVRYVYEYDERRRMISVETIGSTESGMPNVYGFCGDCGVYPGKTIYRYDDGGRTIEARWYQPGNKLVRVDRPRYDDRGNATQTAVYEAGPSSDAEQGSLKVDGVDWPYTWSNGWSTDTRTTKDFYDSHGNSIKSVVTFQSSTKPAKPVIESIVYSNIEYY